AGEGDPDGPPRNRRRPSVRDAARPLAAQRPQARRHRPGGRGQPPPAAAAGSATGSLCGTAPVTGGTPLRCYPGGCGALAIGVTRHYAARSKPTPQRVHPQQSGLEPYLADPNVLVGVDAWTTEVLMVEIRVAVPDATRVHGLMHHLGGVFDCSSVSFDETRSEVQVRSEWESRSLVQVLGAVESWL